MNTMIITVLVLFFAALLGGASVSFLGDETKMIRYPLIFAGSYLFSVTIIHILPEIFTLSANPMKIGFFVLTGFFFQQFLEYFTSGIEHGHFHPHSHISGVSKFGLLVALVVHSLLEGALLTHTSPFHEKNESYSLLFGILLHKVPAAFALTATLRSGKIVTSSLWVILVIFSLSSPVGLLLSDQLLSLPSDHLLYLFALVSGSFLHISTTIFVEFSPNHRFGFGKLLVSISGAALAIITEYLL